MAAHWQRELSVAGALDERVSGTILEGDIELQLLPDGNQRGVAGEDIFGCESFPALFFHPMKV
jgi:hypothetical protein